MAEAGEPAGHGAPARGIGRGLSAILPTAGPAVEGLRDLPLELIEPNPRQPRRHLDGESLMALAESITARGVLQPVVVNPLAGGRYELVAGERRVRAARLAGLDRIPAIVRRTDDAELLELALVENMAREDLTPVEEARACATLVDDLGLTKEELARRVGRSRVSVSNLIRLLGLPDGVLEQIESGDLTEGHGRAILMCRDQAKRRVLARDAAKQGWSVRETERRARRAQEGDSQGATRDRVVIHPDLADALGAAEDALTAALGREVRIRPRGAGCRAEIDFDSPSEGIELAERVLRRKAA